jgi:hypothetical protein
MVLLELLVSRKKKNRASYWQLWLGSMASPASPLTYECSLLLY